MSWLALLFNLISLSLCFSTQSLVCWPQVVLQLITTPACVFTYKYRCCLLLDLLWWHPWGPTGKECGDLGFNPCWAPWQMEGLPTPAFRPENSIVHGIHRIPYSPRSQRVRQLCRETFSWLFSTHPSSFSANVTSSKKPSWCIDMAKSSIPGNILVLSHIRLQQLI